MSDGAMSGAMTDTHNHPDIDLAGLHGTAHERAATLAEIRSAFEDVGYFYAANFGPSQTSVDSVFDEARRFHALPDDHKRTALQTAQGSQRGWIQLGTEPAYEAGTIARCESFDLAMELPGESSTEFGGLGANLWPDDLPGFQGTVYAWYLAARTAARQLFVAFAEMYDLPSDTFTAYESERSSSMMRLLRYPPNNGQTAENIVGISAHTDYEAFTLMGQTAPGLELLTVNDEWISPPVVQDRFIVIVGDMLERLTNGKLRATRHRVVDTEWERLSLILFNAFDADAVVAPLPEFVSDDNPCRFESTTQVAHINAEVSAAVANIS
ncbi:MAG: isopenicillin N synthase-like dioxygenase [Acidimicrobiales bacterium]|jgi:isopenicillin N synthase-like dioxygenase